MSTLCYEKARYVAEERRRDHVEQQSLERALHAAGIQTRGYMGIALCMTVCALGRMLIRLGRRLEQFDPVKVPVPHALGRTRQVPSM